MYSLEKPYKYSYSSIHFEFSRAGQLVMTTQSIHLIIHRYHKVLYNYYYELIFL